MMLQPCITIGVVTLLAAGLTLTTGRAAPAGAVPPAARAGFPTDTRAGFPNVVLRTHDGKTVRFYDDLIKGKVVTVNFMFTACEALCPLATENLVKIAAEFGDHLGRDVRMLSISVDPRKDTPQVLDQYAQRFGARPGWYFLTGREQDVTLIRERLGVNDDGNDKAQHTGILVYGNEATGQWAATPALANPRTVARNVTALLRTRPGR